MDEQSLVKAAAGGDAGAIESLLGRHLPGLRAFIRLRMGPMIKGKESEGDLAQSVCREVLQHIDRFQYPGEQGFKQWLYMTALRKIANRYEYYRAGKRDVNKEIQVAPVQSSSSEEDVTLRQAYQTVFTPSKAVAAQEFVKKLEEAFEKLPPDYREVIVLSRIVGLSRTEIAAEMGRSEASIRNLLHRALATLAELLDV